jgi:sec-independent protein translocase protein TatB
MFGIDFPELVIIAVVALVVLGPERLPKAARFAGLWLRRARAQWDSVKNELERELATEEIRRNLRQTHDAMREAGQAVHDSSQTLQREMQQTHQTPDETANAAAPVLNGDAVEEPHTPVEPHTDEASPQIDLFAAPEKHPAP